MKRSVEMIYFYLALTVLAEFIIYLLIDPCCSDENYVIIMYSANCKTWISDVKAKSR